MRSSPWTIRKTMPMENNLGFMATFCTGKRPTFHVGIYTYHKILNQRPNFSHCLK